jgi:ribosomal protection tetracycline resistance protein
MSNIRNIGILSHVDAGKTTITEQFLYLAGAIKTPGDVNKGTTASDTMKIEKERGVSIWASELSFDFKGNRINLVDTPGHADFSAEVERSLQIMDGAILVISAVEGIQAHTWALWESLKERKIPVIFFINKIDRDGANVNAVTESIENDLGIKTFMLEAPVNEGAAEAGFLNVVEKQENESVRKNYERSIENLSDLDEEIMELYLEGGSITSEKVKSKLRHLLLQFKLFPLLTGIAKNGKCIPELLDAVLEFIPPPSKKSEQLSALVYKIRHDPKLGRLSFVRNFSGKIKIRDEVLNATTGKTEKVAQIKKRFTDKAIDIKELDHGNIGILTGLSETSAGDILGCNEFIPTRSAVNTPLMTVRILPANKKDFNSLAYALEILNMEDPKLNLKWYKEEGELHLDLMGFIQKEIISAELKDRFEIEATFEDPTVIYRETPARAGTGFASYTMPKPCWAVVTFAIEPGEPGSGIVYESQVSFDKIKQKYQNEIEAAIPKALEQGIKGWKVTDLKITLVNGEDHEIHSRPGDWNIAVPIALMNGLTNTGTTLLEPILSYTINAPEELLGQITSDILQMRGKFDAPTFSNGKMALTGEVPAATSLDYHVKLGMRSAGKAQARFKFKGYAPVSDQEGVIRPFKGVNPLDRSRWILHNRGAFKADERKM